jgi:hypothetical protein
MKAYYNLAAGAKRRGCVEIDDRVFLKETVREIFKIPCKYCGTLNEITK